QTPQWATGHFM
uniref:Ranatensin-C n=1 Tax=Lithobates pipiens TaxID=8404 RepID=RANC_LITPI|nr:RecName: Full=Ranatensin-C [Lithobates pipiens]